MTSLLVMIYIFNVTWSNSHHSL